MTFRLPNSVFNAARFGPRARLVAGIVLAALCLLAAVGSVDAAKSERAGNIPIAYEDSDEEDDAAPRLRRLEPATKEGSRPDGLARRSEPEDGFADRALDQGRAFLDRYGSDTLVRAVVVGALVQVLCLVFFRMVGSFLRLAARGFAMSVGVAVALYLLGGSASLPVSGGEATEWLGRLADLVVS
jgi:hypothetical protein